MKVGSPTGAPSASRTFGASRRPVGVPIRPVLALLAGALSVAGSGPAAPARAQDGAAEGYRVQVEAARDTAEARRAAERVHGLLEREFAAYVEEARRYYAVRVGDFPRFGDARPLLERVRSMGYADAWIARREPAPTLLALPAGESPPPLEKPPVPPPPARGLAQEGELAFFEGFHGGGDCALTHGWAWDSRRPDEPISVDIYEADTLVATVAADRHRPDLVEAGKGNGAHGFHHEFEGAAPGGARYVEVRLAGTDIPLRWSPMWLECAPDEGAGRRGGPVGVDGRKQARARPVTGPIRLDGRLDELSWQRALFVSDFLQKGPDRSFPPREETEVAFLYDDQALYVGARMRTTRPERIRALVTRRDDPGTAERLLVSLDTYLDRRTAYTFGVTAGGGRLDHHHPRDSEAAVDDSFDPVWQARTAIDSTGWTAELRIPFSQLRFAGTGPQEWGVNVRRSDPSTFLNAYWVAVPLYEAGWASRFGNLVGLPSITASRRVEVAPYALAGAAFLEARPDEGVLADREMETRFGGDLKAGLGPNLTLDATFNPDFGQVEADPAQVNLSAFEIFFEEKRPFFTEGGQLLKGRGPNYFYSRRIGSVPRGIGFGNVVAPPLNSTILGATKLTGRLGSGLSIGGLAAVTSRERTPSLDQEGVEGDPVVVAPATGYGVGRVQQEFGAAGSTAGLIFTGVVRDLPEGSALERSLGRRALAVGGDWNLRFDGGAYEFSGHLGTSRVEGDSLAILRLQRSSARFFQRPDADHVTLDPSRTALSGYAGGLELARVAGAWQWSLGGSVDSPGFEINDAGIQRSADDLETFGSLRYHRTGLRGAIRNFSLGLSAASGWNFEGVRQHTSPSLFGNITWKNFWSSFFQVGLSTRALSDDFTRGGPLMGTPRSLNLRAGLSSSGAALTQWSLSGGYLTDEFGGWSFNGDAGISVRPGSRWQLGLYAGYLGADDSRQFFGNLPGGPEETFGRRYVFSFLERSEAYTQLRTSFTPVPDLTLELYAEPFVSAGRFHDFGELAAARSRELRFYGTDGTEVAEEEDGSRTVTDGDDTFTLWNADFRVRSFRSNAVLRWEWKRGSTLHLIWQQTRWFWEDRWRTVGPTGLWDAFGDPGQNILLMKLTYWFSLD